MKLNGHDKVHMSVCLAEKADGSRCKLFIVSLYSKEPRESKLLHKIFKRKYTEIFSGYFHQKFPFRKRLLVWKSYEAYLSDDVKKTLTNSKVETVIIPGVCTKHVLASDVVWNKPFKDRIQEWYDD